MELEKFHKNITEKKFQDAYLCLQNILEQENIKTISELFLDLEKEEIKLPTKLYYLFSNHFIKTGKIKLAEIAISHYLNQLKINKRRSVFEEIKNNPEIAINKSISRDLKSLENYFKKTIGVQNIIIEDYEDWHFAYWGNKQSHLKELILNSERWNIDIIKIAYEFILKYGPDEEVILKIYQYANSKYKKDFERYFNERNIIIHKEKDVNGYNDKLNLDYDQLAFDIISGKKNPTEVEQKNIISSLKFISESDFVQKYSDLLVAFKMLNMNEVCLEIAKMALEIPNESEDKVLSVKYIQAQCYLEQGNFFEAILTVEDCIKEFALNTFMLIGFLKINLEIYKLTNKQQEYLELNKLIKKLKSEIR